MNRDDDDDDGGEGPAVLPETPTDSLSPPPPPPPPTPPPPLPLPSSALYFEPPKTTLSREEKKSMARSNLCLSYASLEKGEQNDEEDEEEEEEELVDVLLVDSSEEDDNDCEEESRRADVVPANLLLELSREFKKYYFDSWAAELRSQRPASTLEHLREWQRGMHDIEEWVQSEFVSREYHFRKRLEHVERIAMSAQSLVQQQATEIALLREEIANLKKHAPAEPVDVTEQDIVTSTELARQRIDIESRRLKPEAFEITFLSNDGDDAAKKASGEEALKDREVKREKKPALVKTTRKNDMRTTTVTTKQGKTLCVATPR